MNRRGFLAGLGAIVGGVALEQAIPLGRVWSFPKQIKALNVLQRRPGLGTWKQSTAYNVGDLITGEENGLTAIYRVSLAGTSAKWPLASGTLMLELIDHRDFFKQPTCKS